MKYRHRVFIEEYLKCWNASEAARRAGYNGQSNVAGARLIANDSIKAEIERRISERAMSADEVLDRLAQMARADMADFIDGNDNPDLSLSPGKTHLVKKYKVTQTKLGTNIEIELHDSQRALELLGKHHKLFTDNIDISGELNLVQVDR